MLCEARVSKRCVSDGGKKKKGGGIQGPKLGGT